METTDNKPSYFFFDGADDGKIYLSGDPRRQTKHIALLEACIESLDAVLESTIKSMAKNGIDIRKDVEGFLERSGVEHRRNDV